ncbi:MAG: HAMP domain-containing sensor histidine kinase [Eubacteriales bacterium]|nr:HAMP domain-containing sensor histidine kinase [Eubacteriales bacterium]
MIQKLRIKFIVLAMGLVLLVLSVIMGTVNLLNYRHVVSSADSMLEYLLSNDGTFPEKSKPDSRRFDRQDSPELPFETRFFTVRLNPAGEVELADTGKIAAVSQEDAAAYARQVMASGKTRGFLGDYRYAVRENGEGGMIVFLDRGRQLGSVQHFLVISAGISLAGFLAVSLLLVVLSARVVRPIAESNEKQKQFITNASHDLKTPLTVINADVDILQMDLAENEWLQDIQKQTDRLAGLIQELVFLSRMEEDENRFQMLDFPISDVVAETAQSFDAPARMQEKSLTVQVTPLLSCCGDEKAIRQLVTILLDNALKYSDERGSISVTLCREERFLMLTVHNTCAGMEKEDLRHLFDRFYRGDKSRNSQTGGYGIGLSIAKAIVEAHKGSIYAESPDGRSLTVTAVFTVK